MRRASQSRAIRAAEKSSPGTLFCRTKTPPLDCKRPRRTRLNNGNGGGGNGGRGNGGRGNGGRGNGGMKKVDIRLKTTLSGYSSVSDFNDAAQATFKENVAAASDHIASADDVTIISYSVSGSQRSRTLLSGSLDVEYFVTVSDEDGCDTAQDVADEVTTELDPTIPDGCTPSGTGAICFSGDSTVTLESGD